MREPGGGEGERMKRLHIQTAVQAFEADLHTTAPNTLTLQTTHIVKSFSLFANCKT